MISIPFIQNSQFKTLRSLAKDSKFRYENSSTILEGVHLVQSYLDSNKYPEMCVISSGSLDNPEVKSIVDICRSSTVDVYLLSDHQFKIISNLHNGIGILAVVKSPIKNDINEISKDSILIDGVQDPGNMGGIIRTAVASGVRQIICSEDSTDPWSPKALRAGMGAQFNAEIYTGQVLKNIIINSEINSYATSLDSANSLFSEDLTSASAWIVGSEGKGISKDILNLNIKKVYIPQEETVESLNVAAATAICLFEQRRQRLFNK